MIEFHGDFSKEDGSNLLANFKKTTHKLSDSVLDINGMSGRKYRIFINNFIESKSDARYLEIGSWLGSTACSAMFGNSLKVTCIDNWSEFDGPKDKFTKNVNEVIDDNVDFSFIESDFRNVDFDQIGKFNIYLFDGPHAETDHYDGIVNVQPALDETYLLIIDDWNWQDVREGTIRGLSEVANIVCSITVQTSAVMPEYQEKYSDWHNGYFIAVCQKKHSITDMFK